MIDDDLRMENNKLGREIELLKNLCRRAEEKGDYWRDAYLSLAQSLNFPKREHDFMRDKTLIGPKGDACQ